MTPWPAPKDRGGSTVITVAGVRYRVEGTGHSVATLTRSIKDGLAVILDGGDDGKGDE